MGKVAGLSHADNGDVAFGGYAAETGGAVPVVCGIIASARAGEIGDE